MHIFICLSFPSSLSLPNNQKNPYLANVSVRVPTENRWNAQIRIISRGFIHNSVGGVRELTKDGLET